MSTDKSDGTSKVNPEKEKEHISSSKDPSKAGKSGNTELDEAELQKVSGGGYADN